MRKSKMVRSLPDYFCSNDIGGNDDMFDAKGGEPRT